MQCYKNNKWKTLDFVGGGRLYYFYSFKKAGERFENEKKLVIMVAAVMLCSLGLLACGSPCNVTFDSRGGSSVAGIENIKNGSFITPPANPQKTGYVFGGWYKDKDAETTEGNEWVFDVDTITEDITLYAHWTTETYAITYFDVAAVHFPACMERMRRCNIPNNTATDLANPTKTNWLFEGWFTDSAATGTPVTRILYRYSIVECGCMGFFGFGL